MQNPLSEEYNTYLVEGDYVFTTDDGRIYSVSFEEQPFFSNDEFAFADRTFEVFLTLQKAPPVYSTDPKIGVTLATIIRNFISIDPLRIVCFTCDTTDGRHLARYKRFNEWFSENNDGHHLKLEDSVPYPSINKLFLITLIIRNDNPHRADILVSFVNVNAYLRSQK